MPFFSITIFSSLLKKTNILVDIIIKNDKIKSEFASRNSNEYKLLKNGTKIANENKIIIKISKLFLSKLSGLLILYISKTAVYHVITTAIVDV